MFKKIYSWVQTCFLSKVTAKAGKLRKLLNTEWDIKAISAANKELAGRFLTEEEKKRYLKNPTLRKIKEKKLKIILLRRVLQQNWINEKEREEFERELIKQRIELSRMKKKKKRKKERSGLQQ